MDSLQREAPFMTPSSGARYPGVVIEPNKSEPRKRSEKNRDLTLGCTAFDMFA